MSHMRRGRMARHSGIAKAISECLGSLLPGTLINSLAASWEIARSCMISIMGNCTILHDPSAGTVLESRRPSVGLTSEDDCTIFLKPWTFYPRPHRKEASVLQEMFAPGSTDNATAQVAFGPTLKAGVVLRWR